MFTTYHGVDFSGARAAGRNLWVARLEPVGRRKSCFALTELVNAGRDCGSADRAAALDWLVRRIAASDRALWGMDFPFGLPVEVLHAGARWPCQLDWLRGWDDDAYALGVECVRRALKLGGPMHIRRLTDAETKAPLDCYHYRIIYQTFFGMRDVLGPLQRHRHTAILPFQYRKLPTARRVLVESCPGSTLKRLGLPHQNYKQPEGGPLTRKRLRTRHAILGGLSRHVAIGPRDRRVIMRNGGGDALDAVVAAFGAAQVFPTADHRHIARHPRYPREGRMYC